MSDPRPLSLLPLLWAIGWPLMVGVTVARAEVRDVLVMSPALVAGMALAVLVLWAYMSGDA